MDPAIIGVFIPIVAISLGIPFLTYAVWTGHKQKLAKYEVQARAHRADDAQSARIDELEDRIRVLERIVTDKGYDVAHQIEALRDQRLADEEAAGVPLEIKQRGAA